MYVSLLLNARIIRDIAISLSTLVLNSRDRHEKYGFLKKMRLEKNLTTTFSFNMLQYNLSVQCY